MKSLRDSLPEDVMVQMRNELGPEEMLRLLWAVVVGPSLGASTRVMSVRRNRLRIAVADATWKRTLSGMEQAVLEAVQRVCGEEFARGVEFVEDPTLAPAQPVREEVLPTPCPAEPPDDLELERIADPELRQMFRQSAEKYFARAEGTRK